MIQSPKASINLFPIVTQLMFNLRAQMIFLDVINCIPCAVSHKLNPQIVHRRKWFDTASLRVKYHVACELFSASLKSLRVL